METIQETKELQTPSGEHKILVKAYLTGEDRRANRRFLLGLNTEGKIESVEGIEQAENELLKQIVVEIDGSKENIVDRVMKMRDIDYDFIFEVVTAVSQGLEEKKKEIFGGNTNLSSAEQKSD